MRKVLYILSELADADLEWFVAHGRRRTHGSGTVLIEEGRQIDDLSIVLDGRLSVRLGSFDDREIAVLHAGEVLGELSFLDSRPPSATVVALEDVSVLSVPRSSLADKLRDDTAFAARFYRALGQFLSARLRRTQLRLGYGEDVALDETAARADEIDPELLDTVTLAGARFDVMMRRLRSVPVDGRHGAP